MIESSKRRDGFTLVELLVVIGIIAVLIGILLPVISKARKQAVTVTCMANLRGVGQLLHIYASENKNSLPWGFYRSDLVSSTSENQVDEADPNTSLYIWWSVIRSYMRKGVNADNGSANSSNSISSRGMKGLTCPAGLSTDRGVSYAPNMIAMPDREWEKGQHATSGGSNPWPITPAHLNQLFPDNILMWDVDEIPPSFSSQYVVGYETDGGSFTNPKFAWRRYREMADIYAGPGSALANDTPIKAGANKELGSGGAPGDIRWRHGNNDSANFLYSDGTVKTLKITVGTPGNPNCRGDALRKYFRIKSPGGFRGIG